MKALGYGTTTKVLHLLLVLGVIAQLALTMTMEHPKVGVERSWLEAASFEAHEVVGLTLLALVIIHLIHTLRDAGDESAWHILFPWLQAKGRTQLINELKMVPGWLQHGPPPQNEGIALPGAVHGAGLLLLLLLGSTGACIFFGLGEDGSRSNGIHDVMELHSDLLGTLIWVFLFGHAGMAFWHDLVGHQSKSRIFFF